MVDQHLRKSYVLIGFDPVTFAVFTPRVFLCEKRAVDFMVGRRREDKSSYFRVEEVPLDVMLPEGVEDFYEQ